MQNREIRSIFIKRQHGTQNDWIFRQWKLVKLKLLSLKELKTKVENLKWKNSDK